jgi:hypothetical protein
LSRTGPTAGFGLVEALVTLLVLSIGLLGLGRLQAGLWRSSGDVHAAADALLIAQNLLEITPVDWLSAPATEPPPGPVGGPVITQIGRPKASPAFPELTSIRLDLRWRRPSGEQTLDFITIHNREIRAPDARWLLPSP